MSIPPEAGPSTPGTNPWTEHRNAQGRVYWYHQIEKRSVWEKPSELRTARERAIDSTPWKEYQSGERKYYVHSVTKESSWTLPKELKDLFDTIPDEPTPPPGTPGAPIGSLNSPGPASVMSPGGAAPRPIYSGPPPGFASPNGAGASVPTGFAPPGMVAPAAARGPIQPSVSIAGGEEAFLQLLKDKGVTPTWTWEQTMREIITEPLYKSLATLAERKAAFSKYTQSLRDQEENSRRERAREIEPRVRKQMQPLINSGRIKAWLSYEGMLCRCNDQSAWKALEQVGLGEARELWAVIRREVREKDAAQAREIRHRNMDMLMTVLRSFEADVLTRWKDARQTILESEEWKEDEHLHTIDMSDMLAVFDEHMKTIEREKGEELKAKAHKRKRQDRLKRDWFRETLQAGKQEGWLHARTDFSEIYERFKGHENFIAMLGQPGSSALDLFLDVLDPLEQELKEAVYSVEQIIAKAEDLQVDETTAFHDFHVFLKNRGVHMAEVQQRLVLEELQRIKKEENRRSERKLRHLSEDLRYALKKVAHHHPEKYESEEELSRPWEEVRVKLQELRLPEWVAFDEVAMPIQKDRLEEARKAAWERFVQRQRERREERKQREAELMISARSEDLPRKKKGEDGQEDDRRRSSRRAGKVDEDDSSRTRSGASRRERRAGDVDDTREKDRKERRRSAAAEDYEAVKRPRIEAETVEVAADENADSEKEEGEV